MIETVKTKKQMRLDELIKYVWDNDVQNEMFRSKESDMLVLVEHGRVFSEWTIDKYETFTVEVEKEITKNTIFEWLIEVRESGIVEETYCSISDIEDDDSIRIYALIDKKIELVWEAE